MARTEVRKECPSCGLGVPLEAKVCEFCGWDFEEEDEWVSQIEKLEQELITEKSKPDDNAVERMIKSSLHSSSGEKPKEAEEAPEKTPAVLKKKIVATGSVKVKIARPLEGENLKVRGKALEEEVRPVPKPAPAVSESKPASIRIDVSKTSPPPEEFDLEKELAANEKADVIKERSAEKTKHEGIIEATPKGMPAVADSAAPATRVRRVRRVVSRPAGALGSSPIKTPASPAMSSPNRPATAEAAPAKVTAQVKPKTPTTAPAKPTPATVAPKKEEKKGLFGRRFGGEKEGKPEAKRSPSKITPAKPQIKMFQCPLCNTMVGEEDKTCKNCGAEFE